MKKIIAITLLAVFGFTSVANAMTLEEAQDTFDMVYNDYRYKLDTQYDGPLLLKDTLQGTECGEEVDDFFTRWLIKPNKNLVVYSDGEGAVVNEKFREFLDDLKRCVNRLEESDFETKERTPIRTVERAEVETTVEVEIEPQEDEVELTPSKEEMKKKILNAILALKASGEPLSMEKLLPILIMLRS